MSIIIINYDPYLNKSHLTLLAIDTSSPDHDVIATRTDQDSYSSSEQSERCGGCSERECRGIILPVYQVSCYAATNWLILLFSLQ